MVVEIHKIYRGRTGSLAQRQVNKRIPPALHRTLHQWLDPIHQITPFLKSLVHKAPLVVQVSFYKMTVVIFPDPDKRI